MVRLDVEDVLVLASPVKTEVREAIQGHQSQRDNFGGFSRVIFCHFLSSALLYPVSLCKIRSTHAISS